MSIIKEKTRKKAISLLLLVAVVFSFNGCALFQKKAVDVSLESVFPKETSLLFVIDHTNIEQLENLKELVYRFPDLGLFQQIIDAYNKKVNDLDISFDKLNPILSKFWKIGFGIKVDEEKSGGKNNLGFEAYLAGKFSEADKVQEILDILATKGTLNHLGGDSLTKQITWGYKKGNIEFYLSRYSDIYFLTRTYKQRSEILAGIENGDNILKNDKFIKERSIFGENYLGYVFVNSGKFSEIMKVIFANGDYESELAKITGNIFSVLSAEKDGFRGLSKVFLKGDMALINKFYPDSKVSITKKVPGEGIIFYFEGPVLEPYLEEFINGLDAGYEIAKNVQNQDNSEVNRLLNIFGNGAEKKSNQPIKRVVNKTKDKDAKEIANNQKVESNNKSDAYKLFLDNLGNYSGLDDNSLKNLLESPYAFAVYDSGEFLPGAAFFMDLKDEKLNNAKVLIARFATYFDQVIKQLDMILKAYKLNGLIKKEIKIVDGAAFHKYYIDFTAIPEEFIERYLPKSNLDLSKLKVELYFGLANDNVLFFALYPDFNEIYGIEKLADYGFFKEGVSALRKDFGHSIVLFRSEPVLNILNRFVGVIENSGSLKPEDKINFEKFAVFISALRYIFGSQIKEIDGVKKDIFIRIDKKEFDEELIKDAEMYNERMKNASEALEKVNMEGKELSPSF